MRAVGFDRFGPPEVLKEFSVAPPVPGPFDLLVRVRAAGLNPVDGKLRSGARTSGGAPVPPEPGLPVVPGFEGCGIVESVGASAEGFAPGDRVWYAGTLGRSGSYAQFQAVDHRLAARAPGSLTDLQAASAPVGVLTAWEALLEQMEAGDARGRHLLVTAGAGGVGSFAIQIGARVLGLRVTATASRPESAAWCRRLGARDVVDHARPLAPQFEAAGLPPPDYVLHAAEPSALPELFALLAPLGKICAIVVGEALAALDVSALAAKRGTLGFESLFTRSRLDLEPARQGRILSLVAKLFENGVLESPLSATVAWDDLAEGHRRLETRRVVGKLAVEVPA